MNFNKEIILDTIKDFLANFSKEYTKAFIIAIINDIMSAEQKEDGPVARQLLHYEAEAPELASEVKFSSGGSSTKSQYWKITSDFNIEVWNKEADAATRDEQVAAGLEKVKKPVKIICPWDYSRWYWTPPAKEFPKRRGGPDWISDKDRDACKKCDGKFSALNRRHHCRTCGEIFCGDCSGNKWPLYKMGYPEPQKVCDDCFKVLDEQGLDALGSFETKEDDQVFGVQLTHGFRTPYFFLVETRELRTQWLDALYVCCRNAAAPVNPNPMMAIAFEKAHKYVWNSQGPWWRWWKVFGSEEEMITVLLAFVVERRCMSTVLSGLGVPYAFRRRAEGAVRKTVEGMVSGAIDKAWPVTLETVGKLEEPMREKLGPLLGPIGEAKAKIIDSLRTTIGDAITGAIDTCAKPLLEKVLPMAFSPLLNSHILGYGIWRELFEHVKDECKRSTPTSASQLHGRVRSASWKIYYKLQDKVVDNELRPMEMALRLLGNVPPFNYLNPWGIRRAIYENLNQLMNDAFYTLEMEPSIQAALEGGDILAALDEIYPTLSDKFYADSKTVVSESMVEILDCLIGLPIRNTVYMAPGVKEALDAADGMIPEALGEFMSVADMFDELLTGVIDDVVKNTVEKNSTTSFEKLDAGYKGMNE